MAILGYLLLLFAVLIPAVNEASARGKLGVNPLIGIRFASVKLSGDAWKVGHAAARVPMVLAGVVFAVAGVYVLINPIRQDQLSTASLFLIAPVFVCFFAAGILADRAARAHLTATGFDANGLDVDGFDQRTRGL
jgi:hypothetical protein